MAEAWKGVMETRHLLPTLKKYSKKVGNHLTPGVVKKVDARLKGIKTFHVTTLHDNLRKMDLVRELEGKRLSEKAKAIAGLVGKGYTHAKKELQTAFQLKQGIMSHYRRKEEEIKDTIIHLSKNLEENEEEMHKAITKLGELPKERDKEIQFHIGAKSHVILPQLEEIEQLGIETKLMLPKRIDGPRHFGFAKKQLDNATTNLRLEHGGRVVQHKSVKGILSSFYAEVERHKNTGELFKKQELDVLVRKMQEKVKESMPKAIEDVRKDLEVPGKHRIAAKKALEDIASILEAHPYPYSKEEIEKVKKYIKKLPASVKKNKAVSSYPKKLMQGHFKMARKTLAETIKAIKKEHEDNPEFLRHLEETGGLDLFESIVREKEEEGLPFAAGYIESISKAIASNIRGKRKAFVKDGIKPEEKPVEKKKIPRIEPRRVFASEYRRIVEIIKKHKGEATGKAIKEIEACLDTISTSKTYRGIEVEGVGTVMLGDLPKVLTKVNHENTRREVEEAIKSIVRGHMHEQEFLKYLNLQGTFDSAREEVTRKIDAGTPFETWEVKSIKDHLKAMVEVERKIYSPGKLERVKERKEKIQSTHENIKEILERHEAKPTKKLIEELNTIIPSLDEGIKATKITLDKDEEGVEVWRVPGLFISRHFKEASDHLRKTVEMLKKKYASDKHFLSYLEKEKVFDRIMNVAKRREKEQTLFSKGELKKLVEQTTWYVNELDENLGPSMMVDEVAKAKMGMLETLIKSKEELTAKMVNKMESYVGGMNTPNEKIPVFKVPGREFKNMSAAEICQEVREDYLARFKFGLDSTVSGLKMSYGGDVVNSIQLVGSLRRVIERERKKTSDIEGEQWKSTIEVIGIKARDRHFELAKKKYENRALFWEDVYGKDCLKGKQVKSMMNELDSHIDFRLAKDKPFKSHEIEDRLGEIEASIQKAYKKKLSKSEKEELVEEFVSLVEGRKTLDSGTINLLRAYVGLLDRPKKEIKQVKAVGFSAVANGLVKLTYYNRSPAEIYTLLRQSYFKSVERIFENNVKSLRKAYGREAVEGVSEIGLFGRRIRRQATGKDPVHAHEWNLAIRSIQIRAKDRHFELVRKEYENNKDKWEKAYEEDVIRARTVRLALDGFEKELARRAEEDKPFKADELKARLKEVEGVIAAKRQLWYGPHLL